MVAAIAPPSRSGHAPITASAKTGAGTESGFARLLNIGAQDPATPAGPPAAAEPGVAAPEKQGAPDPPSPQGGTLPRSIKLLEPGTQRPAAPSGKPGKTNIQRSELAHRSQAPPSEQSGPQGQEQTPPGMHAIPDQPPEVLAAVPATPPCALEQTPAADPARSAMAALKSPSEHADLAARAKPDAQEAFGSKHIQAGSEGAVQRAGSEPAALEPSSPFLPEASTGVQQAAHNPLPIPADAAPANIHAPVPANSHASAGVPPAAEPTHPGAMPRMTPSLPAPIFAIAHMSGPQRITIRLSPPELGSLHIRIDRPADAPARVEIKVEHAQTLDLLLRDQPRLQQALDQAGVPADGRNLVLMLDQPGDPSHPPNQDRPHQPAWQLTDGAGPHAATGEAGEPVTPVPLSRGASGLNIIA